MGSPSGLECYSARMDYIEFKLWKLGVLALIVFLLACFNLLPGQGQREPPPDEDG